MSDARKEVIACPSCSATLQPALVAKLKTPYVMGMTLRPHPGTQLEVRTVTKSMDALAGTLKAVARELGGKVMVVVESIATNEAGEVDVRLMVVEKSRSTAQQPAATEGDDRREMIDAVEGILMQYVNRPPMPDPRADRFRLVLKALREWLNTARATPPVDASAQGGECE